MDGERDELKLLLKLYDCKPGRYVLQNGLAYRVWYDKGELKVEEDLDAVQKRSSQTDP